MSESKATLVVTAIPNPEAMGDMQTYLTRVGPLLMSHGGSMIYRGKTNKAVVGDVTFGMLLVMGFDSVETIEKLFATPEYKELIPYRNKGFKKMDVVISSAL
ncbi:MAG: DUF1330 domain-containing protein [Mariprofundales bacterium]